LGFFSLAETARDRASGADCADYLIARDQTLGLHEGWKPTEGGNVGPGEREVLMTLSRTVWIGAALAIVAAVVVVIAVFAGGGGTGGY
jgi:hypothetical protein